MSLDRLADLRPLKSDKNLSKLIFKAWFVWKITGMVDKVNGFAATSEDERSATERGLVKVSVLKMTI